MPHYKYLIIGGGMTADSAVKGIRGLDTEGSIGVIASEMHRPYKRPPLTKGLWKGKSVDSIWMKSTDSGVDLHLNTRVATIDPARRRVIDEQGTEYTYDKLLIAAGGTPRRLQFDPPGVIYFRTFDDYLALRAGIESSQRVAVIGGGFIGSELAAALAINGKSPVMIFPDDGIGGMLFPKDLSEYLNQYYRERGVEVIPDDVVSDVETRNEMHIVKTLGGREIEAGAVVAGLGILPNVALAEAAGIAIDNGIAVDRFLRTSQPGIYAAGDAVSFTNPLLGKRIRVEHEDNALMMGEHAGRVMAGDEKPYDHLPYFYSDLFDLGYEAVGELDSRLETFSDWVEPYQKGVVYYLKDRYLRGVLLWNVWDKVPEARELIGEAGPFKPGDLKGRITD